MTSGPQFRLRWSPIDGPELRCAHCAEWWSITPEFWRPGRWAICRACENERGRLYQALMRCDAGVRAKQAERSRRYRRWLEREAPEYLPAYERERRAKQRERLRAYRQGAAA